MSEPSTVSGNLPIHNVRPRTASITRLILSDFFAYLKRPDYSKVTSLLQDENPIKKAWRLFRAGLLLSLLGGSIGYVLMQYVEGSTGVSLRQNHGITGWGLVLTMFTLIPLVEESVFRLILRPTPARVWWMMLALGIELSVQVYFYSSEGLRSLLLAVNWVGLGLAAKLAVAYKSGLKIWWERNFRWLFYASSITFGLVHLINCDQLTIWHWLLAPFITLPQLMAGFFNGYVRMNYGFWYGVAMHAMTNAIPAAMAAVSLMSHK